MKTGYAAICQNCGKERGNHKAKTLHCPLGKKSRVGYTTYNATMTFRGKVPVNA